MCYMCKYILKQSKKNKMNIRKLEENHAKEKLQQQV